MRNLITFGFFLSALLIVQLVQAQTTDDIINKHIEAMGGKEKMMSLKTVKMIGSATNAGGAEVSIIITKMHLVGLLTDRFVEGTHNYQLITPTKGWIIAQGQSTPSEMMEDNFQSNLTELDLQGAFINYKEKGTAIEFIGKESVDGTVCYTLKAAFKNGNQVNFYIDSNTNRIFKRTYKIISHTYTNYKQNTDGYWFAYTTTNTRGVKSNFDKIETNIIVDEKIFDVGAIKF